MADEFPYFSLGIIEELDEHFLYDLDNEDENEFLAAVDLETLNATSQVDNVTVEKTNKSSEVNKQRFKNLSNASIDEIVTKAETKSTRENTKSAVRVFEGTFYFCKDVHLSTFLYCKTDMYSALVYFAFVLFLANNLQQNVAKSACFRRQSHKQWLFPCHKKIQTSNLNYVHTKISS